LKGLSREEIAVLVNYMHRQEFREGEIIVREGESGNSIFFLIKGRAKVFVDLDEAQEPNRKNRISTLFRGTIFGEMSFLDNKPRSASVEAEEDCACFFLTNERIRVMNRSHPDIAYKILMDLGRVLSERIRIKNAMVKHLAD
jgi:CRP-like cAMP-binding protein